MNSFSRRVSVEFIGDAASLEKTYAQVGVATKEFGDLSVATQTKVTESVLAGTAKRIQATRASVAEYQTASASFVKGSDEQIAAAYQLGIAQKRLAVLTGETSASTLAFSGTAKRTEKDFGKTTRGILAGSGAFTSLGRSLAFASGGFLLFASGAALIRKSIDASIALAVTQRQVAQQLRTTGKSWAQYGDQINTADLKLSHISGFTNQALLQSFTTLFRVTGNVSKALQLNSLAASVARGRNISLTAASNALAKAQSGSFSALRRLNIVIPLHSTKLQALAFVQEKYAGQAKAGTTLQQRFSATLVDTEEIIGKALLPTVNKITKEFGDWLAKMNESGRLQKDVADTVHLVSDAFKVLGAVIGTVDKVTGSFKNTFEALLALFAVKKIFTFGNALIGLAAKWGIVTTAASEAAAAETVAAGAGAAGGAGVAVGAAAGAGIAAAPIIGEAAALGFIAFKGLTSGTGPSRRTTGISGSQQRVIVAGVGPMLKKNGVWYRVGRGVLAQASPDEAAAAEAALTGRPFGPRFRNPATGADSPNRGGLAAPPVISTAGPRGAPTIFKSFTDTAANALAQARAALTKGTQDDVAAAKAEIAQIKKEIASGHLKGAALIQALQAEAGAINTIQSAQAAAIQATTARIQNLIDPLKLEVELSRAQATGASPIPALKKLLAAARKELAKGLSLALQKQALDQITSLKQQIKQAQTQPAVTFTESAKLQLALAKDQALGRDPTKDLQKLRKAILRFIAAHKKNTAALTDAYNQLYAVNQQLGSTIASALGGFKQASTRALTKGLGLTPAQRRALRARLSQLGPGGTIPGSGIGAAGFIIGTDGRPLVVHTHINIDGKRVADNTTRHQQRHRRRNPRQRRGPNAGGG